jgi:vacuolar-type H+-ATPase subunit H
MIPMSKEQMKKFERAKRLGKGMVITLDPYQQSMCGSGFEEVMRDLGQWASPVLNAAQDRAVYELQRGSGMKGKGAEEVFRDMGRWASPVLNAAQDRAIYEIQRGSGVDSFMEDMREKFKGVKLYNKEGKLVTEKKGGRVKKGKGFFDDLGRSFQQTFAPVKEVFQPDGSGERLGKEIAKELIYKGIPGATGALAGTAGAMLQPGNPLTPVLFGVAGERAGEELAKEVGRQSGYGMKRKGKGLMSDAFAMAKTQGKRVAKSAISKAKTKAKELVNQYLDLGEKEARDMIGDGLMSDALAMAKSKGKKVAKEAIGRAKSKAKELVSQYLDLGEQKAQEMLGEGSFGGNKKKMSGGMMRRMKGRALLVA